MKVNEKLSILLLLENSKASKDGKVPITIGLTIDGKRAELSLGQKVHPERWHQEGNCAKGNSEESRIVNAAIDSIKVCLRKEYDLLASQHAYVSSSMVKLAYKGQKPIEMTSLAEISLTTNAQNPFGGD